MVEKTSLLLQRKFIFLFFIFILQSVFYVDSSESFNPPSPFGKLTSSRWAYGSSYQRKNLTPVENPNKYPEPQPRREHPFDLAVSGDGTKVYVGLRGSELEPGNKVVVYDIANEKVIKYIVLKTPGKSGPPASSPYRLTMHPGGRFLFITNRFSNFASIVDTKKDIVVNEVPLDFYCQGISFNQDGSIAFVTNRYLDQVFVVDIQIEGEKFNAAMRKIGGLDDKTFFDDVHEVLIRKCGSCHDKPEKGFFVGADPLKSFYSAIPYITLGSSKGSRLLRATRRTRHGGYADVLPKQKSHGMGIVVFKNPESDPDYQLIAKWIDGALEGPGIPVGNMRSKPKVCVLTKDGRYLFVGNTGTQDISIIDTRLNREVGGIYIQNLVNDLKIFHSSETGHEYLIVSTEGIGFGVGKERDPLGGESWDSSNPAAQYSLWRDVNTGKILPREDQEILGPFDAVDGTAAIKFRDIQNDILFVDINMLNIPDNPPKNKLSYILKANRYESHRGWVRYTSDTAESTYGDVKGDIPPDLMRVVGAMPEKMVIINDSLFVTMQGSNQVQELKINPGADDFSNYLIPKAVYNTGMQPMGISAGLLNTPAAGKLFVANFLGGSITVIDIAKQKTKEVIVDPSIFKFPVPSTNAERGEIFAHTSLFSSDGDTSCFHCHYLDMGDGRSWGVSQVTGQEYIKKQDNIGNIIIGGTMGVPQMRNLFNTQPFFFEGVLSAFEPRSMIMEHSPAEDFNQPNPQGDFTSIEAHYSISGADDVQSGTSASTVFHSSLEERRDEMFRQQSIRYFGKAFNLRDFQRFVGEWQISEPRLLPNPYDQKNISVLRGKKLFNDPQAGCVTCHPPPHFAKKNFKRNKQQAFPPLVTLTPRDGSFTLISMNRLDEINGFERDLEPWDKGRAEVKQGHFTSFPLRGIWDRPPVFLHNGIARTLREVLAVPGHPGLQTFKYEPLIGGVPERPGRREVGFNMTFLYKKKVNKVKAHLDSEARIGFNTHGGTSHLTPRQIDDLVNFMNSIE